MVKAVLSWTRHIYGKDIKLDFKFQNIILYMFDSVSQGA